VHEFTRAARRVELGDLASVTGEAATPRVAQPKTGGTLRVSSPGDITTTDGNFRDGNAFDSLWQVYDRLTFYNDKLDGLSPSSVHRLLHTYRCIRRTA
jgi:hypothetical protein